MSPRPSRVLRRSALRVQQNPKYPLYLFTLTGEELHQIADISRLDRDETGRLIGYQRGIARKHVNNIAEYLNGGDVLFPNSIILALCAEVKFTKHKGRDTRDDLSATGTIEIPLTANGGKPAWIVDGQQRAMALMQSSRKHFPVPVNAFVAVDAATQREHFLRVNSSRPLPRGLITELLPELATILPPMLAARKIPAALCEMLSRDPESPFRGLIRRASTPPGQRRQAVVTDTALIKVLEDSLNSPSGCLFPHRNIATGETDFERIRSLLLVYWNAVRDTFPEAWGLPPSKSRLMHSVGLRAMGRLMDRVMSGIDPDTPKATLLVRQQLGRVASTCHWTAGRWDEVGGLRWNELQNLPSHLRMLSNVLVRSYVRGDEGRG
jgi:DGQHR domain-containing protein